MSIKENKKNETYLRIGLPEEKLNEVFERCVDSMKDYSENREVFLTRTRKESVFSRVCTGIVASVAAIAIVGLGIYAVKYYSEHRHISSKAKNVKELTLGDRYSCYSNKNIYGDSEDDNSIRYSYKAGDCKSEYELVAGEWNSFNTENALEESSKACYDSHGNLKEGYEIRKISADNSGKTIEVAGRDFIEISPEQTKNNSTKNRKLYYRAESGNKLKSSLYKKGNEEYFSYKHVYFLQGNTFVRITCDDDLSVCFDRRYIYENLEYTDGKVKTDLMVSALKSEWGDKVTTRFIDSNVNVKYDVFGLKDSDSGNYIEKIYNMTSFVLYDEDGDAKDVTLYYADTDNILWRISGVKISVVKNVIDFSNLEMDSNYKKEKVATGVTFMDDNNEKGYFYGNQQIEVILGTFYNPKVYMKPKELNIVESTRK